MKVFVVMSLAIALAGCLATSKAIVGPDGEQNQLISCPKIQYCYEKASEVCNGPYKIVDKNVETSTESDGSTDTETTLLVKCGRK